MANGLGRVGDICPLGTGNNGAGGVLAAAGDNRGRLGDFDIGLACQQSPEHHFPAGRLFQLLQHLIEMLMIHKPIGYYSFLVHRRLAYF